MYAEASDETLASQAQNGNEDAFFELYNRYIKKVYNRIKSRIPAEEAEDVTQETFIAVMRSLKNFEQRSRFSTWLYTIVNRQIADFYRRSNRTDAPQVDLDTVEYSLRAPTYEHENLDEMAQVQKAIQALPDHYQEIILQRFADGLTFADIATERGQSLEAVKSLYRRAIQALRDQIGETEDE